MSEKEHPESPGRRDRLAAADDSGSTAEPHASSGVQKSVIAFVEERTGDAPRISLHAAESIDRASPAIDPSGAEEFALPQGAEKYQLMGEIARGGMGTVLLGHDTELGRDVALKVLHQELSHRPQVLQRFVEEAQIGAQLQHPGIVPVYELGLMAKEQPYFAMKLVKGRTLATLLAERKSPKDGRRKLLDVFKAVCQTVAYAHSRGVIHRDLKPANIMVGAFGEVQVVDWGLAKVLSHGGQADERGACDARSTDPVVSTVRSERKDSGSASIAGSVMGTPAYMPPEQAAGHVDRLDERSDVFSLGAILCEVLTGSPPYRGESRVMLIQAALGEVEEAQERLGACQADEELVKLAQQCLMCAPSERPRSAAVVAERIGNHLESLEERALQLQIETAEAHVRARAERKARNLTLALAAAVLGLGITGGGGWIWAQTQRTAHEREDVARRLARIARDQSMEASVNTTLNEASLLLGQKLFGEAAVTVDRARTMAEAGDASEGVRQRITSLASGVELAADAARKRATKAAEAKRFVANLDDVSQRTGSQTWLADVDALGDWGPLDAEFLQVFRDEGILVDEWPPAQVAAALTERGIGGEVSGALHSLMVVRRRASRRIATRNQGPEDKTTTIQILEIAHLLDDDPLRADLREAMLSDDVEMLRLLEEQGMSVQPPSTLRLLSVALDLAGEHEDARRVLRNAIHRFPDDLPLRVALIGASNLIGIGDPWSRNYDPLLARELLENVQVANALRPDNRAVRRILWLQRVHRVYEAMCTGDPAQISITSRKALAVADWANRDADEDEDMPLWHHNKLGGVFEISGDIGRAAESFRRLLPDPTPLHAENVARFFLRHGMPLEAEKAVALVLLESPEEPSLHTMLACARALQRVLAGEGEAAVAGARAAVEHGPGELASGLNNFAWRFAVGPPRELLGNENSIPPHVEQAMQRMLDEALRMSEEAVSVDPQGTYISTLGALRYRVGDFGRCLLDLERAMELRDGGDAYEWLFLAMAHMRLGNEEQARSWYERADRWIITGNTATKATALELSYFRAEARSVLGKN